MQQTMKSLKNRPAWVDLASDDAAASRDFYSRLFGWQMEVSDDPQYGGYAMAKLDGKDAAGIGPKQDPSMPTVWSVYVGTDDIDALARDVVAAGGSVVAAPFDVGEMGKMVVFADPIGAVFSAWQGNRMSEFATGASNSFGWAELNGRGIDQALPFYEKVFGLTRRTSEMGADQPPYHELQLDSESVFGAMEMSSMLPAEVPSYWLIYFTVDSVDDAAKKATDLGATQMVEPQDMPGGRFAILTDPQGAQFGLLAMLSE